MEPFWTRWTRWTQMYFGHVGHVGHGKKQKNKDFGHVGHARFWTRWTRWTLMVFRLDEMQMRPKSVQKVSNTSKTEKVASRRNGVQIQVPHFRNSVQNFWTRIAGRGPLLAGY